MSDRNETAWIIGAGILLGLFGALVAYLMNAGGPVGLNLAWGALAAGCDRRLIAATYADGAEDKAAA